MRLFIAVNPGEHFSHLLATQLDAWRHQVRVTWSRPQNWHLTLAFLGEWPEYRLPALQKALFEVVAEHTTFTATAGNLGAFPSLKAPRVLFLHFESGNQLELLAADIRRQVDQVWPDGPQDCKPFQAHLTIARIKKPLPASRRKLISEIQFAPWDPIVVSDFRLISSELGPMGPKYTDLAVLPLKRSDPDFVGR